MNIHSILCAAGMMALAGCAGIPGVEREALRVGFTPNYPPVCMELNNLPAGAEYDFAVALCRELGRPLDLVELPWADQIPALLEGRIDIIMSGMTITPARAARVAFCDRYMLNSLVAVTRAGEEQQVKSAKTLEGTLAAVGFLRATSADSFVRRQCPNAMPVALNSREDVVFQLANQRIQYYVDDFAAAMELVSRAESRLGMAPIPLKAQGLAWAVRPNDHELRAEANAALARWQANGSLDTVLNRWMPYRRQWRPSTP